MKILQTLTLQGNTDNGPLSLSTLADNSWLDLPTWGGGGGGAVAGHSVLDLTLSRGQACIFRNVPDFRYSWISMQSCSTTKQCNYSVKTITLALRSIQTERLRKRGSHCPSPCWGWIDRSWSKIDEPPVNRLSHTSENITFNRNSYVFDKNVKEGNIMGYTFEQFRPSRPLLYPFFLPALCPYTCSEITSNENEPRYWKFSLLEGSVGRSFPA